MTTRDFFANAAAAIDASLTKPRDEALRRKVKAFAVIYSVLVLITTVQFSFRMKFLIGLGVAAAGFLLFKLFRKSGIAPLLLAAAVVVSVFLALSILVPVTVIVCCYFLVKGYRTARYLTAIYALGAAAFLGLHLFKTGIPRETIALSLFIAAGVQFVFFTFSVCLLLCSRTMKAFTDSPAL
ncbi:MAG: hypothetical protein QM689_06335 [Oscillospiraceae bacterium]